jgi:5-methylcytosine-specific restriction protein A
VRRFLFKRDRGVCAICNLDTHTLKKVARRILTIDGKEPYKAFAKSYNMPPERKTWYDADHIVPVSLNGGECGLDGYRTLCVPCHKNCTKELQKYLKENREKAKEKHDRKRSNNRRKRNSD